MKAALKRFVVRVLTWEAKDALARHRPIIVAVAGSVGKTSTKDAVAAAISAKYSVRKSEKSFNSEIGVPLAILGLENGWGNPLQWVANIMKGYFAARAKDFPKVLVLELGADHPGDIRSILVWLHPSVAVMTSFPDTPVHVEFFPSREALWDEDAEVIRALPKEGLLIANGDDKNLARYIPDSPALCVTYSIETPATLRGISVAPYMEYGMPQGMDIRIEYKGKTTPLRIPGILGPQLCYSMLAGVAVGLEFDLALSDAAAAVSRMELPKGRMRLFPGLKGSLLIDDTYNSSPIAAEAALKALGGIVGLKGRKIGAVLGDMRELGGYSVTEHRKIGLSAGNIADVVIAVGESAKDIAESAKGRKAEAIEWYATSEEAGKALSPRVEKGDIILVKGSQGVRMEKCAKHLLLDPEDAKNLPRQERAWRHR